MKLKPKTLFALQMLKKHGSLTSNEAREVGCGDRFAARVDELRAAFGDAAITDTWETINGARFKRYRWAGPDSLQTELAVA